MKSVSIIIPLYNAEAFIENCFTLICNQTFEHSNIECIFVNDGSIDQSATIATDLISKNSTHIKFCLISHDHNQGVSAARNTGIKYAHNEYIYFMDADDTITPNCIQYLINATENYPHANVIIGNIITKKSGLIHHNNSTPFVTRKKKQNLHDLLLFIYTSYSYNKLISKEFIVRNNLYFPIGIPYFEDLHWNLDLATCSDEFAYLPEITYIYEDISTSAMSTINCKKNIVARCHWSLIEKGLAFNEPDNIIEIHLFLFFHVKKLLTMGHTATVSKKELRKVRRYLTKQSLTQKKHILFLYDLQLYQPFLWISELRFFKNRSAKLRLWICKKLIAMNRK